jgi:hypothetical protein
MAEKEGSNMPMRRLLAVALALAAGLGAWAAPRLTVRVEAGAAYSHKAKFGLASMTLTPQIAIWIEGEDGRFVDTVYVTRKSAKASWAAAGGARRPEALPAWSYARGARAADGLLMPDKRNALPDAVSGATPAKGFAKDWSPPPGLPKGVYVVKAELNSSFDWNEAYPAGLPRTAPRWSEVNGQPSVVWEGRIEVGDAAASASLAPVGLGDLRGESGAVASGLEGITSAKQLAAAIDADYRP